MCVCVCVCVCVCARAWVSVCLRVCLCVRECVVLDEPTDMGYPFAFKDERRLYLIPQAAQSNGLRLFAAEEDNPTQVRVWMWVCVCARECV